YYGFIIDPAKCRHGDHKGKVERKIPVVRQQFLCCYEPKDLKEANEKVRDWCLYDYGMELHGTTKRKPYEVFKIEEISLLMEMRRKKRILIHQKDYLLFDPLSILFSKQRRKRDEYRWTNRE
ncbi:MAG: hypothetical protein HY761_10210, partial [Candidatus Omnitrophica bacterium]|nr:hypothetical protein [Candidatus Omnitrophota bacterium]